MLHRLLVAGFALSIILAFSTTAFSEIFPQIDAQSFNYSIVNPPITDGYQSIVPVQPASRPLGNNKYPIPNGVSNPAPPLGTFCGNDRYDTGEDALWEIYPSGTAVEDFLNVRYTSDYNFNCTLITFWLSFYGEYTVGTPDMMVYLWDDDGFGFPGNALDSIFIPFDSLPTINSWIGFDFYNSSNAPEGGWVFSNGEEYHYGVKVIGEAGDVITLAVDDGLSGSNRTSFWDTSTGTGSWGTMLGVFGAGYMMVQSSEYCAGEMPYSDCYTQKYWDGFTNIFSLPYTGMTAQAMRFDVSGPDTLVSIEVAIYDDGNGIYGDDDIKFSVVDDYWGHPGPNVLFTTTVLAGEYGPDLWVTVPVGIVIDETFHVVVEVLGTPGVSWEYLGADNGDNGTGRSSTLYNGAWVPSGSLYLAGDINFMINANICRDPFADCKIQSFYEESATLLLGIGNEFRQAAATKFTGVGLNCQVNEVSVLFYNYYADATNFTHDTKISVYSDIAGLPGVELASITITPSEYLFWPASQTVDFHPLDVYVAFDYWIVIEAETVPTLDSGIFMVSDDGSPYNEGRSAAKFVNVNPLGVWETMLDHYGTDYGWFLKSSHCCISWPPPGCASELDAGWATYQGNQQRTGASQLSFGDAWCNLNLNWAHKGSNLISFTGPVIYKDKVVCSYGNAYIVFDITTGIPLYTLDQSAGDGFLIGTGISIAPTIVNIGGTDIMFIAGGSNLGVGAIDLNTGAVIWQNTILSSSNIFGKVSYSTMILLNDGVSDVLYYTTDDGRVVALDALTGALYTGWSTNPVNLISSTFATGTTDGTSLFYGTYKANSIGDIYSIDAFTGVINWTLSSQGGLVASGQPGYNGLHEGFPSGVVYDNGILYAVSWANDQEINDYPIDGFFYAIYAQDGSHVFPPVATNRVGFSSPIVDDNLVFVSSNSQWENPTGGNLIAFKKLNGLQVWGAQTPDNAKYHGSGLLTCESGDNDDLLFVFNDNGFLECYNSLTGEQIFSRRVEHDGNEGEIGLSGAIAQTETDGIHMIFNDHYGGLYDFKLSTNRPRLEIQSFQPNTSVNFGSNPALPVNVGPIIVNTGCTPLTFSSVTIDENPITVNNYPDFTSGYVSKEIMERADAISDLMSREAFLSKFKQASSNYIDITNPSINDKLINKEKSNSLLASGIPAWFVSVDQPTVGSVILPGDTTDLHVTLNQPLLNRGPQSVYIAFGSNDFDYYLNSNFSDGVGKLPEIKLTIVGGCLVDTTTLAFGIGSANLQLVTNSGRLGTGDWSPHGFEIDGDGGSYYQGSMIYGNSKYSIALNTQDWSAGGGETKAWTSMQVDPNYCDNSCKPFLISSASVGAITSDGFTYLPISADIVCKSYIDSVENFDTDPSPFSVSWDWIAFDIKSSNDSLSMGLKVNTRVIGVSNLPELANVTLEIFNFSERNGNYVSNWYLGQIADYDLGNDVATFDQNISTAWAYNPGGSSAWGSIKIPFGCGSIGTGQDFNYDHLRSVKGLDGKSALFDGNAYLDSAYTFMRAQTGTQLPTQPQVSDFEMHTTYAAHNYEPNGTYSIGIANFGMDGLSNNASGDELADMAILVNKWAGFGRGDVNNDGNINLADIIYLAGTVNNAGPGSIPFAHLSDVNADGVVNAVDITYLVNYYFNCGPCPMGDWMF